MRVEKESETMRRESARTEAIFLFIRTHKNNIEKKNVFTTRGINKLKSLQQGLLSDLTWAC